MIKWILTVIIGVLFARFLILHFRKNPPVQTIHSMDTATQMAYHKECLLQSDGLEQAMVHLEALKALAHSLHIAWASDSLRAIIQSKFEAFASLTPSQSSEKIEVDARSYDEEIELLDALRPLEWQCMEQPNAPLHDFLSLLDKLYSEKAILQVLDFMQSKFPTHSTEYSTILTAKKEYVALQQAVAQAGIDTKELDDLATKQMQWKQNLQHSLESMNAV
jgi:hypothetical protein